MDAFQEKLLEHKKLAWGLFLCGPVFFSCFGFPILNVTKSWPPELSLVFWINLYVVVSAYYEIGGELSVLIPRTLHAVLLVLALTCAGLGCRYLLEFGEVSNTYNFTWPNVLLHLAAVAVLTLVGRCRALRRTR